VLPLSPVYSALSMPPRPVPEQFPKIAGEGL
jgi:hypothetical protein